MSPPGPADIPVDRGSRTAVVNDWGAISGGTFADAVDVGGRRELGFVPRQLLVDRRNRDAIDEVVARVGADRVEVVDEPPLPAPPEGMAPRDGVDVEARPRVSVLRFRELPDVTERGASIVRERLGERATVTSPDAARLLSLTSELLDDGLPVELDAVGTPTVLPLTSATDWAPAATFGIPSFSGRARVTMAWELVEAFRAVRSLKPLLTVAVLDGGFWLAGRNTMTAVGQSGSDLGATPMQLNLLDESVGAGGAGGNKCGDAYSCPWHGNGVAGVATARPNNGLGTAGTGGTVALPVLLKTDISKSQTYRALAVCLAWGVDVLNISWHLSGGNFFFGDGSWVDSFRFATDNGLIVVCAAGNENENIPDESSIRPATRTPGTITVGALDATDIAASFSNHGSSVDIWAPGTAIPTIPDGNAPFGSLVDGTSIAAPFVAGVVAMMRAVNPSIDTDAAKDILRRTAWAGQPGNRATHGLDAFAAVLEAMGGQLPADLDEPNDAPGAARPLVPRGPAGQLGPSGQPFAVLSGRGDTDWHRFTVDDFSTVDVRISSYPLLGRVTATLVPDDPDSRALAELKVTFGTGTIQMTGTLAPGLYRLQVNGRLNLYELTVALAPAPLPVDELELNDSFATATRFTLAPRRRGVDVGLGPIAGLFDQAPGTYDLTIHSPSNHDFFRIATGPADETTRPVVRVGRTDAPVDVILYDADVNELTRRSGVRHTELVLPESSVTFVEVASASRTRYRFTAQQEYDLRRVPEAFQEELVFSLPVPGEHPDWMGERVNFLAFELPDPAERSGPIRLAAVEGPALTAEVLGADGAVVLRAEQATDAPHLPLELDTSNLGPGAYVVRLAALGQPDDAPPGFFLEGVPRF